MMRVYRRIQELLARRRPSGDWASVPVATMLAALAVATLVGCDQPAMRDQPKLEPYEAGDGISAGYAGAAARPPVPGTVARDEPIEPPGSMPPSPPTRGLLERGREQYEIHCTPCHGLAGYGDGIVVQRGFPAPPSLHAPRLRRLPVAHFYDVITNGFGKMAAYGARVPRDDRWAIVAYLRALQLSQHGRVEDLRAAQRASLEEAP